MQQYLKRKPNIRYCSQFIISLEDHPQDDVQPTGTHCPSGFGDSLGCCTNQPWCHGGMDGWVRVMKLPAGSMEMDGSSE